MGHLFKHNLFFNRLVEFQMNFGTMQQDLTRRLVTTVCQLLQEQHAREKIHLVREEAV